MTNTQIKKIENSKKIKYVYIRKGGAYYRPNACGYTEYKYTAGVYDKKNACDKAKLCRDIDLIPVDVNEHNLIIAEKIQEIASNIIIKA